MAWPCTALDSMISSEAMKLMYVFESVFGLSGFTAETRAELVPWGETPLLPCSGDARFAIGQASHRMAVPQVVAALEATGVPYMIGGSVALAVWAQPRLTHDLDFVVDLPTDRVEEFCRYFPADRFFIDPGAMLLTVIPNGPSSWASWRVSPICAALADA